jgi:hypothetical protein
VSDRYEHLYVSQSAYNLGITSSNYYIQNWGTYPSDGAATITYGTAGSLPLASPKPESDLDWLRRRVKEVCWVLPAKR